MAVQTPLEAEDVLEDTGEDIERLVFFSDAVFAIAMTLLIAGCASVYISVVVHVDHVFADNRADMYYSFGASAAGTVGSGACAAPAVLAAAWPWPRSITAIKTQSARVKRPSHPLCRV